MKRIFFPVTNDLTYDQRMNRICRSLASAGYAVTLLGRSKRSSKPLIEKPFRQVRLNCFFESGKLFYLEYNFRLFWWLLVHPTDVICAIDLDSILPCWLVARLRSKKLGYDAHEYFTQMEEIVTRPAIHKAWQAVERFAVPRVDFAYTISQGYARMFEEAYGTPFNVVRNIAVYESLPENPQPEYLLYQGAVNVGRGLEQLVTAMQQIDCPLRICGKGDVYEPLQQMVNDLNLTERVIFHGYIAPEQLRAFTLKAKMGFTLFSSKGLHHQYSLANRFFDYIHAGIPQIAMNYPEYRNFNEQFEVAVLVDDLEPTTLAAAVNRLLADSTLRHRLVANCREAREHFNWQKEEAELLRIYKAI